MRYLPSQIEKKWQARWLKEKIYEPDLKRAKRPFYNLMMFPYPSAEGLHVGNMYAFVGADIYGRMKRMQGFDVFEPIGLDGFGIHSENYALKIGRHPAKQAKISEENFYRQLEMIGNGFAWREKLETYDPEYYRWTQWIFVQMFKRGLAYRKKAEVNWCPSCLTVLADEQVIKKSKIKNQKSKPQVKIQNELNNISEDTETVNVCERCDTPVIKKDLEQWFFRITDYAERLLGNLGHIDWSEKVKVAQRNWIGRSEGAVIAFSLVDVPGQEDRKHSVEVFTTRPDTVFGATFIAVSSERAKLWMDIGWRAPDAVKKYVAEALARLGGEPAREKTGVFSGISAINPATKEKIPVWIADYVLSEYGTGAIMAVPAHDERDFEFAKKFGLPVSDAPLVEGDEAVRKAGGKKTVNYRLRDWLVSRQRYWGPPIPMIFCESCAGAGMGERKEMPGWYAVPEKDLPVKLPLVEDFRPRGTGASPLASVEKFYKVRCPECRSWARRETDVSDTFLDSAWYYLGYLILGAQNEKRKAKNKKFLPYPLIKKWYPVDMYIGGAEHAVLHLLYVRFLAMVFYDWNLLPKEEPFKKFRAHGLLIKDGAKMSKSKGNVVNPDEYIRAYGADALRMYLMFLGPFEQGGDFRDTGIKGITRFLERVYKLISKQTTNSKSKITKAIHKTIKKVTEDIENLRYNTAISSLMVLLNEFEASPGAVSKEDVKIFLKLLAPFAPHMAEELFQQVQDKNKRIKDKKNNSIHREPWPKYDERETVEDIFMLVIQVNGRVRDQAEVSRSISREEAEKLALSREKITAFLGGKTPQKVVFVPGRLINIVV